jgi:hypothetical protein
MRLEAWAEWLYAVFVVPSALAEHSGLKAKGDDRREENLHSGSFHPTLRRATRGGR